MAPEGDNLATLRLAYEDVVRERDRLRDARGSITKRLGLPASAGIAIGLVGALREEVSGGYLIVAGGLLAVMVLTSIVSSLLAPYRTLRVGKGVPIGGEESLSERQWLEGMIRLERALYPELEKLLDRELIGLRAVQLLFLAIIGVLVAGLVSS